MKTRIGLAIGSDAIRVVAVNGRSVAWTAEASLEDGSSVEQVIETLLAAAPVRSWPRPMLSTAVWGGRAQVRLVTGLPDVDDSETLAAVIRENIGSFFLKNGVPLVAAGVRVTRAGAAIASVVDQPVVETIQRVCRARRWRLGTIAPTPVVLPFSLQDGDVSWRDGHMVSLVRCCGGTLETVSTYASTVETDAAAPQPIAELATLGGDAIRFADAYGAALMPRDVPLALGELTTSMNDHGRHRHLLAPALLCGAAVVALVLSPIAASLSRARAEARIETMGAHQWQDVTAALNQLDRITTMLAELNAFASSRPVVTEVLAEITRALPGGSALADFQLTGGTGLMRVITAEPQAVMDALAMVPNFDSIEAAGGATAQTVNGTPPPGLVITFRLARGALP